MRAVFPLARPAGTAVTICVLLQPLTVAATLPNLTVPPPWVAPKFEPRIVTTVPGVPNCGNRALMLGPTVNGTPLLLVPETITTTLPVVAPMGTGTTILELLQLVGTANTPLKLTVLVP
jgi:hypothetical protein